MHQTNKKPTDWKSKWAFQNYEVSMNIKSNPINPIVTQRVHPFGFMKVALVSGLFTVGAIALAYDEKSTEYNPTFTIPNTVPTDYGIQALKITSDRSGIAVIKLDGFLIQVGFDFEAHPDSYGVTGSDFTAVEINNLSVEQITDSNGKTYRDFTDYNDHRNINQLISAYIEKNNLVEAV